MTSRVTAKSKREFLKTLGVGTAALAGGVAGAAVVAGAGTYFVREPEVSALRGQVNTLSQANTDLENQRAGLSTQASTLQSQVNSLTTEKSNLQSQLSTLQPQVSDLQSQVDSLTTEKSNLQSQLEAFTAELERAGERIRELDAGLEEARDTVSQLTSRLGQYKTATGQPGERRFDFVAFAKAKTVDGVDHRVAMEGAGRLNAATREVEGGGTFHHFDNTPPVPKPFIAYGRWEATKFVDFRTKPAPSTWGGIEASVLDIEINLLPEFGPAAGRTLPATLHYVCNIGAAGLSTGEDEGFTLTIPGTPFVEGGATGPFKPLVPPLGITDMNTPF